MADPACAAGIGEGGGVVGALVRFGGGGAGGYSWGGGFRALLWVLPSRAVRAGLFRGIGDWRFPGRVGARGLCPKLSARYVRASPSEVFPAGKLQGHFTYGFDYRHSL